MSEGTLKVVELHPELQCDDVVTALRNIANDIEAGECAFSPDSAVIILSCENERRTRDGVMVSYDWQTHGIGKASSVFSARGIMATALYRFENE